jgi:formylmethanofuran dehydrogenase subunit E
MKENKITCFVCGAKLTEETEYSFDGKHMCQHCYDEQTVTCDHCGERIWCENQRGSHFKSINIPEIMKVLSHKK